MKKNYIKASTQVIKVQKGLLSFHPKLSKIYTYKDKGAIEELAQSMRDMGQLEPLTIDSKYQIVSGGRRLMAALLIDEMLELDVIVKEDHGNDVELTIVYHNRQRDKTPREILNEAKIVLASLGNRQGKRNDLNKDVSGNPYDVKGKDRYEKTANVVGGVSASTLRNMMDVVEFEDESDENKSIGILDKVLNEGLAASRAKQMVKKCREVEIMRNCMKTITMPTISTEKDVNIYNKSCIDMSEVKTGSVQVVFTSIPYFNLRKYDETTKETPELGQESSVDNYVANITNHLRDVKRVLKETGSFFLNIGESYSDKHAQLVPTKLLLALCEIEGWYLVNEIIWHKTNSIPQSLETRLKPTYEKIFHLVRNPNEYYYNECKVWNDKPMKIVKGPADRNTKQIGAKKSGWMLTNPYTKFKDFLSNQSFNDVIVGNNASMRQKELTKLDNKNIHPAVMPSYLPLIPILSTSKVGIILDPFSGSATTGQVALLLGRRYIGYELIKDNYELSVKSIKKTIGERSEALMEEIFQMAA
jgi:DNA modification methylase